MITSLLLTVLQAAPWGLAALVCVMLVADLHRQTK